MAAEHRGVVLEDADHRDPDVRAGAVDAAGGLLEGLLGGRANVIGQTPPGLSY
jgi:hypothetical protein